MKTDDLIIMLSSGPDVGVKAAPPSATALPLLAGGLTCLVPLIALLGIRPDLLLALTLPMFWLKVSFLAILTMSGWLAAKRLAMPGASTSALPLYLGTPVLVLWGVAGILLWQAAPEERALLFWGTTWRYCPILITLLSLPIFIAALRIMRSLAPTNLRLAGAAAGFAAGATAALLYCIHCPEMSPVFVGFWYLLGILVTTVIGGIIGPRALAW